MVNKNTRSKVEVTIAFIFCAIMLSGLIVHPASAIVIQRSQTVWAAGFGQNTGSYQPWNTGSNQAWTTYLSYEPMFGTNVATGSLIYWLGRSIVWASNKTTIVITLRSDLHWTSFDPSHVLGVTNTTAITTADVKYSFQIHQQMGQLTSLVQRVGNIATAFKVINSTTLNVNLLPAYNGSSEVMRQLTYGFLIFPKAVWENINATYDGDLQFFANNWLDGTTPAKWQVASGMYMPYYFDSSSTIAKINTNWWGKNDPAFGRLPNPQFWGYTNYASNDLALLAMQRGDLDFDGNYLAGLSYIKASYPNIKTYYDDAPYFPDKSADMLVPNHDKYPLNETWLHQALMTVISYSAMSSVDSGYLATPNVMLIPKDDAAARATLNLTLVDEYSVDYDGTGTAGKSILSTYCTFSATYDTWFTKALGPGGYHYPLAEWTVGNNGTIAPWKILDFNGWTDVDAMDTIAANSFTSLLDINVVTDQGSSNQWGVVQAKVNSGDYDLFNMVMSGQLNMNMYERYFQMFSTHNTAGAGGGINAPLGNYTNEELSDLIEELDSAPAGSAAQWEVANAIQTIIGEDLPIIPLGGHPDWQVYSTSYWTNWPNSETNPMLAGSPFAGTTQNANNLAITFGLQPAAAAPSTSVPGYDLTVVIALIGVVGLVLALRMRKPKA